MQIIKGLLIAAALIVMVFLLLVALLLLAFGIAADVMRRQDEWTDNGSRKEKTENDGRGQDKVAGKGSMTKE